VSIEFGPEWGQFNQRLGGASRLFSTEIHRALQASVLMIEADARRGAPQDTRRLHSSINSRVTGTYPTLVGVVGPSVRYGFNVEFGRRAGGKMPPVDALMGWVRRHMSPRAAPARAGRARNRAWASREAELRSTAFAVARAIKRRGIDPQPYMRPAYNQNRTRIESIFRRLGVRVTASLAGNPLP
jgi:hypothetical protein